MAKKLKWKKRRDGEGGEETYISHFETEFTIYDARTKSPWLSSSYRTGKMGTMSYHSWGNGAFYPRRSNFTSVEQIKECVQRAYELKINREIKYLQSL